ncbi:hypothetical protein [Hymenobacter sp. CRA2]|uniref:hypothetical protein n=1 Tax=Hymenobacter sp. CRA2 TaxID=1955620 RepID=UPI0011161D53|nr:hypothetical protein [Hymenobacter sp. CRA2]
MITQKHYDNIISNHSEFIENCESFKNLLQSNKLTLSTDIKSLEFELRVSQFMELMNVSESTKFKYSVAKTDEAKKQLVYDNTCLDGNELMMDIESCLINLEHKCRRFASAIDSLNTLSLNLLLKNYNLSPVEYLDSILIDWSKQYGKEYKAAQSYAEAYNTFLTVLRGLDEWFDDNRIVSLFNRKFGKLSTKCDNIEVDEVRLYNMIYGNKMRIARKQNKG